MSGESKDSAELKVLQQKLQRDINCLSDESRFTRQKALDKLLRVVEDLVEKKEVRALLLVCVVAALMRSVTDVLAQLALLNGFAHESLVEPLLKRLEDETERNRDTALETLTKIFDAVVPKNVLAAFIPVVYARLGATPVAEPCTRSLRTASCSMRC